MNRTTAVVVSILLALLSLTVGAQVYRWVDKDGKVQYSDQPPPSNVSKSESVKINSSSPSPAASAATAKAAEAEKGKAPDKSKASDADKAKQAAEQAKAAKQNEEFCRSARGQLRMLQEGGRIGTTSESGERALMSDEQIEAEKEKVQRQIAETCK
jgi:hypothetical protein